MKTKSPEPTSPILTDEEIITAINEGRRGSKGDERRNAVLVSAPPEYMKDHHYALIAQAKRIVEWGNEPCPQYLPDDPKNRYVFFMSKRQCSECWSELEKEVGK